MEAAAAKQSDALAAQIGTDILAYLRTLSIAQLQGANGLAFLREDLNERIRQRSQGKAREIVIQTLVVQ
jgi:flagellar FliL protein